MKRIASRHRPGIRMTPGAALLTLLLCCGCISTEYGVGTHSQDVYFYSVEREVALGRNLSRSIAKQLTLSQDPRYNQRLRRIANPIINVCDRQEISYYFFVIDEDVKNAFSIPGGYVYVYRGLMDILDDEELAYVVAHEVAHIVSRHAIKRMQAAIGMNILLAASTQAATDTDFQGGLSLAMGQILVSYSRKDELNADELSVKYLSKAGLEADAALRVIEKLYNENKKGPLHELSYFRTHPYAAQRIRHIKEYLGIPLDVSDYIN